MTHSQPILKLLNPNELNSKVTGFKVGSGKPALVLVAKTGSLLVCAAVCKPLWKINLVLQKHPF